MAESESYPTSFGPYLRYAITTGFRNFALLRRNVHSVDKKPHSLFLLVRFHEAGMAGDFKRDLQAVDPKNTEFAIEFGPDEVNARHVTVIADKAVVASATFEVWNKYVSKVELSLPMSPTKADKETPRNIVQRWSEDGLSSAKLLIGVLDDGCPFAAAQFLRTLNPASTRVRAIWDQDEGRQPIKIEQQGKDRFLVEPCRTSISASNICATSRSNKSDLMSGYGAMPSLRRTASPRIDATQTPISAGSPPASRTAPTSWI